MVDHWSRIARWGEVAFPVSEDELSARLQDAGSLGKASCLSGIAHITSILNAPSTLAGSRPVASKLPLWYELVMPSRRARALACSSGTVEKSMPTSAAPVTPAIHWPG